MNSGRITIGFIIIGVIAAALFFGMAKMPTAYAATNSNGSTTAQVVINGFVSITLSGVPIYFSAMDPGIGNTAANATGGFPMTVTVDSTTNVDVNVYMNGSTFVKSADNFPVENMKYNVSNSTSGRAWNATCFALVAPCNYTNVVIQIFNETARLGTARATTIYNWISVPLTQAPGTYTNAVKICAVQTTISGC